MKICNYNLMYYLLFISKPVSTGHRSHRLASPQFGDFGPQTITTTTTNHKAITDMSE